VHFLGSKPHTDVPRYLQNVDVNVMCYRTSEGGWWTDIYPLKLHEYLAVGKPVVASDIDAVREFSAVVAIAATTKDWIAALTKAIEGTGVGNVAERQLVAGMNSWDERVDTLERWFEALPP
jgi:glycosyltransferase involved in cell wall biosynthesis